MADSILQTICDDENLETMNDFFSTKSASITLSDIMKDKEHMHGEKVDVVKFSELEKRIFYIEDSLIKLYSQIGRILINQNIARKDEIIITSDMPLCMKTIKEDNDKKNT